MIDERKVTINPVCYLIIEPNGTVQIQSAILGCILVKQIAPL